MVPIYILLWRPLVPPDSTVQTASWSVQLILQGSEQSIPILYRGPPPSPQNCQFLWGSGHLSTRWFLKPTRAHSSNGILVVKPFCRVHDCDSVTDRLTDYATQSITIGSIYIHSTAMQRSNIRRVWICNRVEVTQSLGNAGEFHSAWTVVTHTILSCFGSIPPSKNQRWFRTPNVFGITPKSTWLLVVPWWTCFTSFMKSFHVFE